MVLTQVTPKWEPAECLAGCRLAAASLTAAGMKVLPGFMVAGRPATKKLFYKRLKIRQKQYGRDRKKDDFFFSPKAADLDLT